MLVGAAVIAVGLVVLTRLRQTAKKTKSGAKKALKVPASSPTSVRNVATETGSVKTPGGRRSARIARKSLGHND